MPFAAAAAVVGAGATMYAANKSSKSVSQANQQAQAQYEQSRQDLLPYMTAGQNALSPTQDLLGLNGQDAADAAMANFQSSPGYQYQLDQGLRAVDAGAAAKGMLRSGATLKAEQTLGNNLAAQDFSTYYNRLNSLANMGLSAGSAAAGVSNNAAQTATSAATADANIASNTASGISNSVNNALNNYAYMQRTSTYQPASTAVQQSNRLTGQGIY